MYNLIRFFPVSILFLLLSCQKEIIKSNAVPLVNAGTTVVIPAPKDSATLVGSATDEDGTVVGYLWSQVSGPGHSIIANPGSASTIVKGLSAGTYLFQLMATDNLGATGVDTVSLVVTPAKIVSLTLSPANNPSEMHIWGNNINKESSDPTAPEIGAVSWTHLGEQIGMRGAVKFDLSAIPAGSTIVSAKLSLFSNPTPLNGDLTKANSGPNNAMLIQQITTPWNAATVKWINQPATTTANQVLIPHTDQAFLDLADINVTPLVNLNANHGFLIRLQSENVFNSRIFCSSKNALVNKRPKLVVEYFQ